MSFVLTESLSGITVIRLNRPDRLNALGKELERQLQSALRAFQFGPDEVAIITGVGRAFCAGEDLKETAAEGVPSDPEIHKGDHHRMRDIDKPFIAAINGFAMGGGFMLAASCDLRVSIPEALLEVSEAKRWHLGGYGHGHAANLPLAVTAELAYGFRVNARRLHELGFINRLAEPEALLDTAFGLAEHLLTLPPASRVNTTRMLRAMRPRLEPRLERFAEALRGHGAEADLIESRRAFAQKRAPEYIGWDDPADRHRSPRLEPES